MSNLATMPKNGNEVYTKRHPSSLPSFSSWVDNLFESGMETGFSPNSKTGIAFPAINIKDNAEEFFLEIAVPGMKKSDFNIDVENKTLTISSETKEEQEHKDENYTRREFGYSAFKRTFTLPNTVASDDISAQYTDGVLTVHLPKKEEAKDKPAKRISIS